MTLEGPPQDSFKQADQSDIPVSNVIRIDVFNRQVEADGLLVSDEDNWDEKLEECPSADPEIPLYPEPKDTQEAAKYLQNFAENLADLRPRGYHDKSMRLSVIRALRKLDVDPDMVNLREYLIKAEIAATRDIFEAKIPKNQAVFYCEDSRTWVWKERIGISNDGQPIIKRYEYRTNGTGVIKEIGGIPRELPWNELQAVVKMAAFYARRAARAVYSAHSADYDPDHDPIREDG